VLFKTLDPEEVETEASLESTDITGGDPILDYCPETPGGYLQMTAGFRAKRLGFSILRGLLQQDTSVIIQTQTTLYLYLFR
jgi:hypothetical protein